MAGYLKPRRGKLATATSQNIVLKRGEVFFEVPTGGVGTGAGKIKMGDGTTAYSSLPYFLEPTVIDVAASTIAFTEASSTDNTTLLNAIASGAQLKTIIGNVKKLLRNLNSSVTQLNNDLDNYLPLSGGRLNENASISLTGYTGGSAAVGLSFFNNDGSGSTETIAGIGALLHQGTLERLYMGVSKNPWGDGLEIYANTIKWNGSELLTKSNIKYSNGVLDIYL